MPNIGQLLIIFTITFLVGTAPVLSQESANAKKKKMIMNIYANPESNKGNKVSSKNTGADISSRSEDFNPKDRSRFLNLKTVLESGLRKNSEEKIRYYKEAVVELKWKDDFQSFWYPDIDLTLTADTHRINRLKTRKSNGGVLYGTEKIPEASIGLSFGEYTVFNWGKDYAKYLNNKANYKIGKEVISQERRDLKHKLILEYFKLLFLKKVELINKDQVRHATFFYRLAREKAALKKSNQQEYYEARAEYLRTRSQYQSAKVEAKSQDEIIADLLNDDLDTTYQSQEELKYVRLGLTLSEAVGFIEKSNNALKVAKTKFNNAIRDYDRTKKENLPLPKFTTNLGAYNHSCNKNGSSTLYETEPGSSNIELVASVNMTWNILGEGGFFNSRTTKRSYINKKIAEIEYFNTRRSVEMKIRSLYQRIKHLEYQVDVADVRLVNGQKSFDATLDNYVKNKAEFNELKDALVRLKNSEVDYHYSRLQHLASKLQLVRLLGLEDFPGENFENLSIFDGGEI